MYSGILEYLHSYIVHPPIHVYTQHRTIGYNRPDLGGHDKINGGELCAVMHEFNRTTSFNRRVGSYPSVPILDKFTLCTKLDLTFKYKI